MTTRWISLFACAPVAFVLALSCGNSDSGGTNCGAGAGGGGGIAGTGGGSAGTNGSAGSGDGSAGMDHGGGGTAGAGVAGAGTGGSGGVAGSGGTGDAGGGADNAGAGGSVPEDTSPLSPAAFPELAFWMDGTSAAYSDIDENVLAVAPSGRVRSMPEAAPLTGSWQAPGSLQRPIREEGALSLKPIESLTGYYLKDTAGTIHTDNSTLAISFRPLNGFGGGAQGGLSAAIGTSAQALGISLLGDAISLNFNHTSAMLKRTLPRGSHVTMIMRFTSTGVDIRYDINGLRYSESIAATIPSETASKFAIGFDPRFNASMYGFVSQIVGIDRAVSDGEEGRLMTWLTAQPIPDAFPVSKPLVAILGDSIANGDQTAGWLSWAYSMLADLGNTYPDLQLLNAATNGSGVPKVKGSDYSDYVLPWYSASRARNILVLAAGTNDLANGNSLSDILPRYYSLLDSARATGWKVVACTILPRSNPGMLVGLAGFETARTTFNADVVANWASHADALANVAAISGMGAAGDSDNLTYYNADKIHPTPAGHALLEPVYRTAVAGLLQ